MGPKINPRRKQPIRGSRSAPVDDEPLKAPSPKESFVAADHGTQDNPMDTDMPEASPGPESELPQAPQNYSTSSIAATSTAPTKPPVRRLASILPRNTPNTTSSNIQDGSQSRPTGLKFKPKSFIRRSKEERDAINRAEEERRLKRQAAEGTLATTDRGDQHGRRGGRGGMGRGGSQISRPASGHLGGAEIRENTGQKRAKSGASGSGASETAGTAGQSGSSAGIKKEPAVKPEKPEKPEKGEDRDVVIQSSTSSRKHTKVRPKVEKEDFKATYISSEGELDSDGAERVNIEHINLISDEESDNEQPEHSAVSKGKQRQAMTPKPRKFAMRPVRVGRQEHMERAVGVNTEASSLTSAELRKRAQKKKEAGGSLFLSEDEEAEILRTSKPKGRRKPKDVEFLSDKRTWKGVYEDDKDDVKVKEEPKDEDVMEVDTPVQTGLPEAMEIDNDIAMDTSKHHGISDAADAHQDLRNFGQSAKDLADMPRPLLKENEPDDDEIPDPLLIRPEDEHEDLHLEELVSLQHYQQDLITNPSSPASAPITTKTLHDEIQDTPLSTKSEDEDYSEERIYLFQLPPLIPSLLDPSPKGPTPQKSKTPALAEKHEQSATTSNSTNPFATNSIKSDPNPLEHDNDALLPPSHPQRTNIYTSLDLSSPPGCLGSITLSTSGRILATWAGLTFEVMKEEAKERGMAQEAVLTEWDVSRTKVEGSERLEEKIGLGDVADVVGEVGGRFVGIPELGRLCGGR